MAAGTLRVMHLMGAAKPGGAETFFVRMMLALHKHPGVEVVPVVRAGGWADRRLAELGVPHEVAGFGGWFDQYVSRATARKVARVAKGVAPDAVMGWMNRATQFVPRGPWVRIGRLGGFYKLKYYSKKVEHLVGNTDEICRYCVKEGWPLSKVARLDNFIPEPRAGWEMERGVARAAWGIPAGAKVLLVSGRLHAVKGVDVAIRALAQLPEDVWLLLAGEGPLRHELEMLASEQGVAKRAVFAGWLDDVSGAAAASDAWLARSRHEPLGNTVLDAWLHGKPVVASRVGGMAALVEDGETGLLVPPDDEEALADAVARMLNEPKFAARMAKAGREKFEREFSEKVVVEKWIQYYRGLKGEGA